MISLSVWLVKFLSRGASTPHEMQAALLVAITHSDREDGHIRMELDRLRPLLEGQGFGPDTLWNGLHIAEQEGWIEDLTPEGFWLVLPG